MNILCLCCAMLLLNKSYGQTSMSLLGAISVKGARAMPYSLEIKVDDKGDFTGYSITDGGLSSETKSAIVGHYTSKKKELVFAETDVSRTKKSIDKAKQEFCFVNATLKGKEKNGQLVFQGNFSGMLSDKKTICATGSIQLIDKKKLLEEMGKLESKNEIVGVMKRKMLSDSQDTMSNSTQEEIVLSKGHDASFLWKDSEVQILVWDDGTFDEDKVSIELNGEIVERSILLTQKPKQFTLELKPGRNKLRIKAINVGRVPPNSAKLTLRSRKGDYQLLMSYNNSGDYSEIELNIE